MHIIGVDFTSAPRRAKPITCAIATLDGALLRVHELRALPSFAAFEAMLAAPGPWVAGFDFPFGQPRPLVEALCWPHSWEGYVRAAAALGKQGFEQTLIGFKADKPSGQKELERRTDRPARSRSPMKLANPPVAKMFFQGAPRLLASGASVLPSRPTGSDRVALEAYPALVVRALVGKVSYKSDTQAKQTAARHLAREAIVDALISDALTAAYGVSLQIEQPFADALVADPSGDSLDAVLCAVQAACAYARPDGRYGIPEDCDPLEGWIVDPLLLR
jgi:hypothetical protein